MARKPAATKPTSKPKTKTTKKRTTAAKPQAEQSTPKVAGKTKPATKSKVKPETKPTKPTGKRKGSPQIVTLSHEQISERAYQIYAATGNTNEYENWCEAERQLQTELA